MSNAIRYFKALSDETRLRLTYVLERYELSVNELVSILEMGQSRVSTPQDLTEAGLLSSRRDGLWVFYSSVREGEWRRFLKAAMPFLDEDAEMRADAWKWPPGSSRPGAQDAAVLQYHRRTLGYPEPRSARRVRPRRGRVRHDAEGCDTSVDLGVGPGSCWNGCAGAPGRSSGWTARRGCWSFPGGGLPGWEGEPEGVSLRIGELSHLPLRDCEADFASINMVLHHLSNPENALAEIRRVLRSGRAARGGGF